MRRFIGNSSVLNQIQCRVCPIPAQEIVIQKNETLGYSIYSSAMISAYVYIYTLPVLTTAQLPPVTEISRVWVKKMFQMDICIYVYKKFGIIELKPIIIPVVSGFIMPYHHHCSEFLSYIYYNIYIYVY